MEKRVVDEITKKELMNMVRCPYCEDSILAVSSKESFLDCRQCERRFTSKDGIIDFIEDKDLKEVKSVNIKYHDMEAEYYDNIHMHMQADSKLYQGLVERFDFGGKTVLDIGTGTGFVLDNFHKDARFIILDISANMLKRNLKKHNNVILGLRADSEQIPLMNSSVDMITLSSVLHHLPDPAKALDEIYRVLKPKGILFIFHEPAESPRGMIYRVVRKALRIFFPKYKKDVKREEKIKDYAGKIFGVEKDEASKKMEEYNRKTTAQESFDPKKLLPVEKYLIKETKYYYTSDTFFCRLMLFIFPKKSGDQFYIIAEKK
ncbi:MAG: class I SAM-dependent methyltransferase [Candidatus Aureabacteria bacterium]|nr:class I SAM-dependent methyltransferase [Candidatus Auribacterota bacterium]